MFKKPKLKGILAFKKLPDTKNPAAPKSAIKKPMAAELPIALFIEYPKYLSTGTFIIAPPIPIGADKKPAVKPKKTLWPSLIFVLISVSFSFKKIK